MSDRLNITFKSSDNLETNVKEILRGYKGDPGYSPTVSIAEVDGGHKITVTDEEGDHVFNVMDGAEGEKGADGVSPSVSVSDIGGGHRIVITDASGNHSFDVMDGDDGSDGEDGADGADGYSPTVSVSEIDGGHRITVSDADGTRYFDVLDGSDGADGEDGSDGADWIPTSQELDTIAQSAAGKLQPTITELSGNVDNATATLALHSSELETQAGDIDELESALECKQDVINDLATIRAGAALGATAIQTHQDISGKQDVLTNSDKNAIVTYGITNATLTDTQKSKACETIGAEPKKNTFELVRTITCDGTSTYEVNVDPSVDLLVYMKAVSDAAVNTAEPAVEVWNTQSGKRLFDINSNAKAATATSNVYHYHRIYSDNGIWSGQKSSGWYNGHYPSVQYRTYAKVPFAGSGDLVPSDQSFDKIKFPSVYPSGTIIKVYCVKK